MRYLFILCLTAGPVFAQDWALRAGDRDLSAPQVRALIEGRVLTFYDNGQSKYSAGGAYSYTYANGGGTAFGTWRVEKDGTVCIAYRNGFSRCDRYVESETRVVLLTQKGERFPVRP